MAGEKSALLYKRDPKTRKLKMPYKEKFRELIELCSTASVKGGTDLLITWPWVLGDNYEEIIESLSRIAEAQLALHIVDRCDETKLPDPTAILN